MPVSQVCLHCQQPFLAKVHKVRQSMGKFCSHACYWNYARVQNQLTCQQCFKTFHLSPSALARTYGKFCSLSCFRLYYKDRPMPHWKREERQCLHCQQSFNAKAAKIKAGFGKFCSRSCVKAYTRLNGRTSTIPMEERFWALVDIGEPHECWPWLGARNKHGYGDFYVEPGNHKPAHRVAYELTYGPTPLDILHQCDNPPCVNPSHLQAGTHQQNMEEAASRGRMTSNRKLKLEQVRYIRAHQVIIPTSELARMFNVSTVAIRCVQQRRTYKYVD